jgi:hypothetical protein
MNNLIGTMNYKKLKPIRLINNLFESSVKSLINNLPQMTGTNLSQTFYKITNREEKHHGYQYKDGLNVLSEPFNSNPHDSCCVGGFYFTDAKHIFDFIDYGCNVREVFLPIHDADFKIVKDPQGDKWRANKIILGTKYDLWSLETIKMLAEKGANIHTQNDFALRWASLKGHVEIVKYLVENGADIQVDNYKALIWASHNRNLEVVKYLVESGADIHAQNDLALIYASGQ